MSTEERVTQAEKVIENLQHRIAELESGSGGAFAVKSQFLDELREIRFSLGKERAEAAQILKERNELQKENKKLRKEVEKLNYRANILVRSLVEEENKNANN